VSKKPLKQHRWRITRIKGTPAADVGSVYAPDAETAIKRAIEEFEIRDREQQKRLVARRVD
jgi:1,2-phenylacetyl-CoA epoxidase PaaB subunit